MLTVQSYGIAMGIYLFAAVVAMAAAYRYWLGALPLMARRALIGLLAGLLMAPAYPGPKVQTLAPALVVALFNGLFGEGWVSAVPALATLAVACGAGILLAAGSVFVFNVKKVNKES